MLWGEGTSGPRAVGVRGPRGRVRAVGVGGTLVLAPLGAAGAALAREQPSCPSCDLRTRRPRSRRDPHHRPPQAGHSRLPAGLPGIRDPTSQEKGPHFPGAPAMPLAQDRTCREESLKSRQICFTRTPGSSTKQCRRRSEGARPTPAPREQRLADGARGGAAPAPTPCLSMT